MDKNTFLAEYNMTEADLLAANITWDELTLIAEEYKSLEKTMRELGKSFIDEFLYDIEKAGIHSYRYRTKDVWHLLEKVVRKKKENPQKFEALDHTNFYKYITDLIGIRVFYLYREDWVHFHKYITHRTKLKKERCHAVNSAYRRGKSHTKKIHFKRENPSYVFYKFFDEK